ncbi:MAG TPA: ABC transporter permease [bacterium]|nr:ABC transporter permease [bacterium]
MKFETLVSIRYFRNTRRSGALSLVTVIAVIGMMLGVAALISVLSVMDGFLSEMKEKILSSTAHAHLHKLVGVFDDHEKTARDIRSLDGVAGVTPSLNGEVMIAANGKIVGSIANGIEIATIGEVVELPRQIVPGQGDLACLADLARCPAFAAARAEKDLLDDDDEPPVPPLPIVIGVDMAEQIGVKPGDIVTVISPLGGGMGATGPVPVSRLFVVVALFRTGMYDYDSKFAYLSLYDAQDFFHAAGRISYLNIKMRDIYRVKEIGARIMDLVGGFPYGIQDWQDMNKTTFKFLEMQKIVMFIILIAIIIVASFGIISTLVMLVMRKVPEVAILKTMGADDGMIRRIFVLDGLLVGAAGTIAGMLLAVIVCLTLEQIEFPLAKDIYFFNKLPVALSPVSFGIVALCALIISFVATLYPAWKASRIPPAEGLRYE